MSKHAVDILLVEDDRRLADLTAEYFEQNGLSVAVESRGDQALSHFAKVKPRVVLLDLMLPGTDGLTICHSDAGIGRSPLADSGSEAKAAPAEASRLITNKKHTFKIDSFFKGRV